MALDDPGLERAASQNKGENQLRFFLNLVFRHWPAIVFSTIAVSLALGLYTMATHRTRLSFESVTRLAVHESPWDQDLLRNAGGRPMFQSSPDALVNRVGPEDLAEAVLRALIQQDIEHGGPWARVSSDQEFTVLKEGIQENISLEPLKDRGLIVIKAVGDTANESTRIAELTARAFIDRNRQEYVQAEQETLDFIQSQIEEVRKQLEAAETAEWQFRESIGFRTSDQLSTDMETLSNELTLEEATRDELRARLAELEEELQSKYHELPQALNQVGDQVVAQLLSELNELLRQQFELGVVYQPDAPPIRELQEEITEKKQAILAAAGELQLGAADGSSLWQSRQALFEQHMQLQLDLASSEVRAATLETILGEMVDNLPELTSQSQQYQNLTRETERYRTEFTKLVEAEADVRTAIRRGGGTVERASGVTTMASTADRRRFLIYSFVLGAIIGLVAGICFAILREFNDTSIRSVEDVNRHTGLEVIGTIPRMKVGRSKRATRRGTYVVPSSEGKADAFIVTHHDPKSPISEAYRALRTAFQFATFQQKPKTVMVTSAVPAEGKTTTAVNMAVTFADSGIKTLLIDTDMRRPHVHHVLRMERGPGLADILREGIDFRQVIRSTRVENLYTISSGRVPPNPSELVGSERMRRLMGELSKEFGMVICDAPSILVVTDPVLLATQVDTVVLVVSTEFASRGAVVRATKHLQTARANVAGVVLNGLETSRRHYYYYYYYYYEDASGRRQRRWSPI